jgi:hypothetical protein
MEAFGKPAGELRGDTRTRPTRYCKQVTGVDPTQKTVSP